MQQLCHLFNHRLRLGLDVSLVEIKIDPKGRISLPIAYRLSHSEKNKKNNLEQQYVITNGQFQKKRCLDVYRLKDWEQLETKIAKLSSLKAEVQAYQRFYLASGQVINLDSQNRLLIPLGLRKYADIQDATDFVTGQYFK